MPGPGLGIGLGVGRFGSGEGVTRSQFVLSGEWGPVSFNEEDGASEAQFVVSLASINETK